MITRLVKLVAVIACGFVLIAGQTAHAQDDSKTVFVSILPQKHFVKRIGGQFVNVSVMVAPGASPATYEPRPKQMVKLSSAELYFAIGVPFETVWLKKIAAANPDMKIVHTETSIHRRAMKARHHGEDKDEDTHAITDPHIWLSPPLVMILARNILMGLQDADPAHRDEYEANYKNFIVELVDLDAELRSMFQGVGGKKQFMVYHPAWGYFADAYGLEQVPVELEGKEPKPAQVAHLIDNAKARDIRVLFVQPQFSSRSAKTIADAIGGKVVAVDPLALDWGENLLRVARAIKAALPQP